MSKELQGRFKGFLQDFRLEGSFKGVSLSLKGFSRVFQMCVKEVSKAFQLSFKGFSRGFSRMFKWCFMEVWMLFPELFKEVSRTI